MPEEVNKVKLKNSDAELILDQSAYDFFTTDPYYAKLDFVNQIRLHSSGCAVFQKAGFDDKGKYRTITIYPHKLIAELWLDNEKTEERKVVSAKDGNKLNCQVSNLTYRTRSAASRQRKTTSGTGYTGVYQEHGRYRSLISFKGSTIHLGMFDSPEEAAEAYNAKSRELFGDEGKINIIRPK